MSKTNVNSLVKELKNENQDYEFYPTTKEIIHAMYKDLCLKLEGYPEKGLSILDIGAGNGNVFVKLDEVNDGSISVSQKYAIEKSKILTDSMPCDIFVIGSDFHSQVLIDKEIDLIFCNPPYSEFTDWVEKIIKQANCKYIYLVIPGRWKNHGGIQECINRRECKVSTIGSFDFIDAERSARADVELICVETGKHRGYRSVINTDPFDVWFDEEFSINAKKTDYRLSTNKNREEFKLIPKENLIFELERLYNADMQSLLQTYKELERINPKLLEELKVSIQNLKEGLKQKISGLKHLYWKELFDNLESITDRLTSRSRERMMDKLMKHTTIDFTADNVYQVLMWVIKNANQYFDEQLLDVYSNLTEPENVIMYKSNKHFVGSKWRYEFKNEVSRYSLDYRFIKPQYSAIKTGIYGSYDYPNGLHTNAHNTINDLFTIGKNLGFSITKSSRDCEWEAGKQNDFYHKCADGTEEIFASVKAYKNGNLHFKLHQEFMKKFNIEAGRLNGWIKSPEEAVSEIKGVTNREAFIYYGKNLQLGKQDVKLIA